MRRWTLPLLGLAASVALTAALWLADVPGFFLLLPFLLWPRRGAPQRVCPACGYSTLHPAVRYCPHDGSRLERPRQRSTDSP